jgi:hypothetical protein
MQASRLTAVGAVLLAAAVVMVQARMEDVWGHAAHFAIAIGCFIPIYALALLSKPEEGPRPTAAQSALLVAAFVLIVASVLRFGQLTGNDNAVDRAGPLIWMSLLVGAVAAYPAARFRSAISTLVAAIAFGLAFVEFVHKYLGADRPNAFRWLFLIVILVYALGPVILRERGPRHADSMVNAAIVAVVAILGTVAFGIDFGDDTGGPPPRLSTWWELVALAVPVLAITYAVLVRRRGPAWSGGAALLLSVLVIGEPDSLLARSHGSLKGWPLVLLVLGALSFVGGFLQVRRT